MKWIAIGLVIVLLVIVGPILTIWALNTLFPALNIPTNLETWAAVVILVSSVSSKGFSSKD